MLGGNYLASFYLGENYPEVVVPPPPSGAVGGAGMNNREAARFERAVLGRRTLEAVQAQRAADEALIRRLGLDDEDEEDAMLLLLLQ